MEISPMPERAGVHGGWHWSAPGGRNALALGLVIGGLAGGALWAARRASREGRG
jgi:hypothetical protein